MTDLPRYLPTFVVWWMGRCFCFCGGHVVRRVENLGELGELGAFALRLRFWAICCVLGE